jgi:hypothetical protein
MQKINFAMILLLILLPELLMSVDYDLNRYQPEAFKINSLDLDFHNSDNFGKYDNENDTKLNNSLNLDYSEERFNREQILNWTGSLALGHNYGKTTAEDNTTEEISTYKWTPELTFSGNYRRYIRENIFLKLYAYGDGDGCSGKENAYDTTYDKDELKYEVSGSLGVGYGRIEDVTRARKAIYILEDLESAGLLSRKSSSDDVTRLAHLLDGLIHLRLFDDRLNNMESLRQIANHLEAEGLLSDAGIESFVIINDIYNYANIYQRKAGWEILPEFTYGYSSDKAESDFDETQYDSLYTNMNHRESEATKEEYKAGLNFSYYYNLNKDLQLDITTSGGYLQGSHEENDNYDYGNDYVEHITEFGSDTEGSYLNLQVSLNWYLNTRTRVWASINYDLNLSDIEGTEFESDEDETPRDFTIENESQNFDFAIGTNYYLSPRLSLYSRISVDNEKIRYESTGVDYPRDNRDRFYVSCSFSVNYTIF